MFCTVVLQTLFADHCVAAADAVANQKVHQLFHVAFRIVIDDGKWRMLLLVLLLLLLRPIGRQLTARHQSLLLLLLLLQLVIVVRRRLLRRPAV